MPIYEYRCNACEQVFEEWLKSFDDTEPNCPVCGGHAERIMSNTTFVLKGGGWYVTEYGNHKASAAGEDGKAATSSTASKETKETSAKADSTSKAPAPASSSPASAAPASGSAAPASKSATA